MSKKKIVSLMIVFLFLASCSSVNQWRVSYFKKMGDSDIKAFMAGVRPDRSGVSGYYKYACFLKERNRYRAAIQEFEKVLALDAGHVQSLNWIGICHDRLGDHETAITFYKRALGIDPDLDYAYNNLGYSHLLNGDFESAVKAFTKAIALDDANPQYHNNLGLAYFKTGRYIESRDHVETGGGRENFHATLARLDKNENRKKNRIKQIDPPAAPYLLAKQTEKEPEKDLKKTAEKQAQPAAAKNTPKDKADAAADVTNVAGGQAKIEISNGNGVPKMASQVGAYLKTKDLSVTRLTNAAHFGYRETKLFYCQGYLQEAYAVAQQIPGWQNMDRVEDLGASGIKIKVLIGHDIVGHTDMFFKAEKKEDSGTRLAAAARAYN